MGTCPAIPHATLGALCTGPARVWHSGSPVVCCPGWVTHVEFYPFTPMKMFSNLNHRPGVVTHVRAAAHCQNGDSARADFDQWIGAMADSRYRMVIGKAFGTPLERALCDEFLAASLQAANRALEDTRQIIGFEIQLWEWDFRENPEDPSYGDVVDRYRYPVEPSSSVG